MADPNPTTDTYDRHARQYAAINASLTPIASLLATFTRLLPGGHVLDAGCGPGRDAGHFTAQAGYRVTGIDLSAGMLALACVAAPGATFVLGDMRRLPFRTGAFDGVWACASLLHLPKRDAPATLAGLRRVLHPGGVLYVGVKQGDGEAWVESDAYHGRRFFAFYRPDEIASMIADAGFAGVVAHTDATWINVFARREG